MPSCDLFTFFCGSASAFAVKPVLVVRIDFDIAFAEIGRRQQSYIHPQTLQRHLLQAAHQPEYPNGVVLDISLLENQAGSR